MGAVEPLAVDPRAARIERAFAVPLIVAALLVVPVVALQDTSLDEPWRSVVDVADWTIWTLFAAEAAALLTVARSRRAWLRSHPLDVAIVVLTVPVLGSLLPAIRAIRALRLLRLLRLAPLVRRAFSLDGIRYAAVVAVVTVLAAGEAFSAVEDVSPGDGIYWAISSATTVGYGDVTPETDAGKVLAVIVMVVGIGLAALLTGAIAERFLREDVEEVEAVERAAEAELREELREVRAALARIESQVGRPEPT